MLRVFDATARYVDQASHCLPQENWSPQRRARAAAARVGSHRVAALHPSRRRAGAP